jgi:DNA-binding CsgD family transcriptional regulator
MTDEVIGRSGELAALTAFVEAVPDGGHALLLEGEAGIGKTILWQEGLRLANGRGCRVLRSRASPSETRLAFTAIGDLFGSVLGEDLPLLVPLQRRALESALLVREAATAPPDAALLGRALLSVVRSLAREAPLLVAVDDAQWIDESSAELLTFVLRRLEGEPVGVLATVRGRAGPAPFELDRAFTAFRRMPVEPLSVAAVHRLLWGRLALTLPRPTLIRVHATSGGNPFFALELGRGIVGGSIRTDTDDAPLPESLQALVADRLRTLPPRVRETLVSVAALSSPSITLLEPLGASTADDVEVARERGVIELERDRIRFTHPLLAPACYAAMPLHRRRRLHRRLAGLRLDPEETARHLALATPHADESIAAALDAAAAHARRRGAVQAAAELAERAVALTPPADVERVGRRRLTAAGLWADAGDTKLARALLEEMLAATAPGSLRAEVLCRLADVRSEIEGNPIAEELLLAALAEPGLERRQRATILVSLGATTHVGHDWSGSGRYAAAGLELAEEVGDPELLVVGLNLVAMIAFLRTGRIQGDLLGRAIELERGIDGGLGSEARAIFGEPRVSLACQLAAAGRADEGRAILREVLAEAVARDDPYVVWIMVDSACMQAEAGHWVQAARLCDETIEAARQTGRERAELIAEMIRAEIDTYRGRVEAATTADLLRAAERLDLELTQFRLKLALAALELCRGDPRASWRLVAPHLDEIEEMDDVHARLAGSVAIEALIGSGDLRTAERLLGLLEKRAAGADTPLLSLAHRCRGMLCTARGEQGAGIAELEAAAIAPEPPRQASPFELGRTLLALGRAHRRAQHKRVARETLERALVLFEELDALPWAEQARSELRRIGGRTASSGLLSQTERQIVTLVVAGRRNREVADELSLSPNTVAWNLSRIYRKLGVSSRTELAAHVAASPPT